nr:hypothetical protein [Chromatium okenii]
MPNANTSVNSSGCQTPHQAVMTALDVAGQTGLKRIVFAATHRQ